jgi:hypothetical protein
MQNIPVSSHENMCEINVYWHIWEMSQANQESKDLVCSVKIE